MLTVSETRQMHRKGRAGRSEPCAVVAQSVEHVIGNDEVGSSNLLNSSRIQGAFFTCKGLWRVSRVLCAKTHTPQG